MTLTLTQKDLMKKWTERALEDISIVCIAYCPICDKTFDAEEKDDEIAINNIKTHIEFDHTFNELKEYNKYER